MPDHFIPMEKIQIPEDRQRKKIESLNELKDSIATKGLFHAIVISYSPSQKMYVLIAGERRLKAMKQLHDEGRLFSHNDLIVPPGEIPYTTISEMSEVELMEVELEENIIRVDLPWQDKQYALTRIHEAKKKANPNQTIQDTANQIAVASGKEQATGRERDEISKARVISKHLDDPEVKRARNAHEAFEIIRKKATTRLTAELHRRQAAKRSDHTLIKGDCLEEMEKLEDNTYDLILVDPPYGVGADQFKARQVQAGHGYVDTPEAALKVCKGIIKEGFRTGRLKSNMFMFTGHKIFWELHEYAQQQGWSAWPRPVIWHKSEEGLVPWGRHGFRYGYENILFLTKGKRGLLRPHIDVIKIYKVVRGKLHGAQKPVDLYKLLIDLTCTPGDKVIDPCCGSGTIFPASTKAHVMATGIERDDYYFDVATRRLNEEITEDDAEEEGTGDVEVDSGNEDTDEGGEEEASTGVPETL